MNSSPTFSTKIFPVLAAVTLVAAAFACLMLRQGIDQSGGARIMVDQTLIAIDPSTDHYRRLGRDELEADRLPQAYRAITRGCTMRPTDVACAELMGAYYAVTPNAQSRLVALRAFQTRGEARSALENLGGSQTTKAQELYALGLLRSSQRVAEGIAEPSAVLYLLRSHLAIDLNGDAGLATAEQNIKKSLNLNPTLKPALEQALAVSQKTEISESEQYEQRLNALK